MPIEYSFTEVNTNRKVTLAEMDDVICLHYNIPASPSEYSKQYNLIVTMGVTLFEKSINMENLEPYFRHVGETAKSEDGVVTAKDCLKFLVEDYRFDCSFYRYG